jgi:hypothetical protein
VSAFYRQLADALHDSLSDIEKEQRRAMEWLALKDIFAWYIANVSIEKSDPRRTPKKESDQETTYDPETIKSLCERWQKT